MTKLTDTQAVILANASQSFDGNVLPLPGSLRGGAQAKVIGALLKRGLIEERTIDSIQPPDASLIRMVPRQLMAEFRAEATRLESRPTSRTALAIIIVLWLGFGGLLLWALWPAAAGLAG